MARTKSIDKQTPRSVAAMLCAVLLCMMPALGHAQTVKYIHTDALGSVVAITDENRNVIERREYEPYGAQLTPGVADGPGYTGHVQDAATGLVYAQQRYYDPGIERNLSVDPVTAYDSGDYRYFNRYAYAFNNPYKFTDPDGRCPSCDRFGDAYASDPGGFEAFEPFAIQATATALAITPVVGPILTLSFRTAVRNTAQQAPANAPKGDPHAPGDAPNGTVIVRGGTDEMPAPGTTFSGSQGGTVMEAGAGVPHGTIRTSTAGEIRGGGGRVEVAPEPTRSGQMNGQHVNVTEGGKASTFSPPQPNPVPKPERIK